MTQNQLHKKGEAWSARFSEPMSDLVKRYTASVFFDKRLALVDIEGLARARRDAGRAGDHRRGGPAPRSSAAWRRSSEEIERGDFEWQLDLEDVHLNIEARLTAAGRRRRQAPAHRPLAQRPGRDRYPPVAARRDRRDRRPAARPAQALLELAEQNADTIMPGFTHLQVAQPVTFGHHLLAYVEMFGARRRTHGRLPQAREPPAAGRRRAGRHQLPDRPPARGQDARLRRRLPQLAGRRVRPRLRDRIHRRRRAGHDARLAPVRRTGALDEPARRLHRHRRPLLHRLVDHAAEEKPGRARTGARQDRPRERPSDGAAHADEGPAAGLQQGQPGRQGAAVRHRRHGADTLRIFADMVGGITVKPEAMGTPRCRVTPPPPIWPTTWSRRACRSATRTKRWRTRSRRRSRTRWICRNCRWQCCRPSIRRSRRMSTAS